MSKFICNHPWTHFEVNNPNGDVTMCCDNNTVLGNVNDQTTEEIWNGDDYQAIRRDMRDRGAHAICPHTCPVMAGFKKWQELDWYKDLPAASRVRENAALNEQEFSDGALSLKSLPRWMRFCYSYACNLDCYHCYQREEAKVNITLPDTFVSEIYDLAKNYQVLYFFGGEPFMYKPVTKMMGDIETPEDCRYCLITNATLLTDPVMAMLETRNIGIFAVSLDAATAESFDKLRVRGQKADWNEVMSNVRKLAEMKKRKGFIFSISMTINSVNAGEIEQFVDLCLEVDAEPDILLVASPDESLEFQKQFLFFTPDQFTEMDRQITACIKKVEARGFSDAVAALKHLKDRLRGHRLQENSTLRFVAKTFARKVFRLLPAALRIRIKDYALASKV